MDRTRTSIQNALDAECFDIQSAYGKCVCVGSVGDSVYKVWHMNFRSNGAHIKCVMKGRI